MSVLVHISGKWGESHHSVASGNLLHCHRVGNRNRLPRSLANFTYKAN